MAWVEGCDCAHTFHLVEMASSLDQAFSQQRERRSIAEQQQPLWLCEFDVPACNLRAGLALGRTHPGSRRVEAGEGGAVGFCGRNGDCCEHLLGECPGLPPNRPAGGSVLERRRIAQQHDRRLLRPVRQDSLGARAGERKLGTARKPLPQLGKRLLARLNEVGRRLGFGAMFAGTHRLQPVSRFFLDGKVHSGLEPPGQCASRLGNADRIRFPAHTPILARH